MTSDKQREANRLNAQRSTGPNTPEGKTASSNAEIALIKVNQARLDRIENGILNESRERVFAEQHIAGPDGKPLYRFDRTQYPPEEQRTVANLHLGAAWLRVQEVMKSISRQQARLATRLRSAEQRFDQLQAARQAEPEPEKPVSQNEPISSQLPVVATPPPLIPTVERTPANVPPMPLEKAPFPIPLVGRRTPEKESA